jgi:hypothetical protein
LKEIFVDFQEVKTAKYDPKNGLIVEILRFFGIKSSCESKAEPCFSKKWEKIPWKILLFGNLKKNKQKKTCPNRQVFR